jgi:hypothetical protein
MPGTGERSSTRNILLRNDFPAIKRMAFKKKPNLNESLIKQNRVKPILISEGEKYEKSNT